MGTLYGNIKKMTPERLDRLKELFNKALELEPTARAAYLELACKGDAELREEVEQLLSEDEFGSGSMDEPLIPSAAPILTPGSRLGPYEILGALGSGGMGQVYRARDTRLKRTVAIKALRRSLSEDPRARLRFEREAQAVARMNHPHICAVYDIGHQEGIDYLVMEYLEGETLAERIRNGPLAATELIRVAIEIASALNQAHRRGIIHRDLKPSNVVLTTSGSKLLDFGVSKIYRGPNSASTVTLRATSSTGTGALIGTLAYMSPEQARGEKVDARTDLFSFGAVLYEMASGRRAFDGATPAVTIDMLLNREPTPLSVSNSGLPEQIQDVIGRALQKDRELRYQTASELLSDLINASALVTPVGPEPSISKLKVQPSPQPVRQQETLVPRPRVDRRLIWVSAAVMLVLVLAWFVARSFRPVAVVIRTNPPGATITVNGQVRGPSTLLLRLRAGVYQVGAQKEGYQPASAALVVKRGTPAALDVTLQSASPASVPLSMPLVLRVTSDLPFGKVKFDHAAPTELQDGQFANEALGFGRHTIEITSGSLKTHIAFEVAQGRMPVLTETPTAKEVKAMVVTSFQSQAHIQFTYAPVKVTVDHTDYGEAGPNGIDIPNLTAGTHEVVLTEGNTSHTVSLTNGPSPTIGVRLDSDRNVGSAPRRSELVIPEELRLQKQEEISLRLKEVEKMLARVTPRTEAQRHAAKQIRYLVAQAYQAHDEGDIQKASGLSERALVQVQDLYRSR